MTPWTTVPITLFVVVLQVAAAPSLTYFGVHADLVVVWLGCYAAVREQADVLPLIAVGGIALGLTGTEPLGASLLALLPIAGLAVLKGMLPAPSRFLAALGIVAVGGLLYTLLQPLAAVVAGEGLGPPLNLVRVAPRAAVLDALTAAVWYWPVRIAFLQRVSAGFRRA